MGADPKKARLFWVGVVLWTCLIFSFSLQSVEESSERSSRLQERLQPWVESWEETLGVELIPPGSFHRMVRKAAHFSLFLVLGGLALGAGLASGWPLGKAVLGAGLWVLVSAVLDETLQTFVPGRSGEWTDVLLDTLGAAVGISLTALGRFSWLKMSKNRG